MLSKDTFKFLRDLEQNNNREWFQAQKAGFEAARADFAGYVSAVIGRIAEFDPEVAGTNAADCLFRIYRDIRFSLDKSPYKTNFGAYIAPGGRKSARPGYYIHLDPYQSFLAGGKYMPDAAELNRIRAAVAARHEEFFEILAAPDFRKNFGDLSPDHGKLKKPPKNFPADHPAIEYLKLKSFTVGRAINEKDFDRTDQVVEVFRSMKPFISFLRASLPPVPAES